MARIATAGAFLLFALSYLLLGLKYELTTRNGELGPGLFPRVVGVLFVVAAGYNLLSDVRRRAAEDAAGHWRDAALVAGATVVLVAMIEVLGTVPALVVFMLGLLSFLNRGRWVTNVALSVVLPVGLYVFFALWLNVNLPEGRIGLTLPG